MNQSAPDPHSQSQYQVRFDWGIDGAEAVGADADVVVWVDAISMDPAEGTLGSALPVRAETVLGSFRNRTAVAKWVLARQGDKGDRFVVAVVAAGEARRGGALRFALEDLLAAGAIIDALADVGVDYCSPESAAASAAFTGMRHAVGPLVAASASGQEARARGDSARVDAATVLDADPEVRELRNAIGGTHVDHRRDADTDQSGT